MTTMIELSGQVSYLSYYSDTKLVQKARNTGGRRGPKAHVGKHFATCRTRVRSCQHRKAGRFLVDNGGDGLKLRVSFFRKKDGRYTCAAGTNGDMEEAKLSAHGSRRRMCPCGIHRPSSSELYPAPNKELSSPVFTQVDTIHYLFNSIG
ncbi:hypothetical protein Q1695_015068 [Nippostrongylus brasiliensis]|nr:hypothetical protein Q1695_015068 [Nippostrongylus brasiliensis]